jgi:hemoglobin/transferrin/lactoferrin receptor protein
MVSLALALLLTPLIASAQPAPDAAPSPTDTATAPEAAEPTIEPTSPSAPSAVPTTPEPSDAVIQPEPQSIPADAAANPASPPTPDATPAPPESQAESGAKADEGITDMSLGELMSLEVSAASFTMRSVKDLPVTLRVVTREEILKNNYRTLVDVLKDLPGIRVSQPGNAMSGEKFFMRGLEGNSYAKVLLNGAPITPNVVLGLPLAEQLPLQAVDRIEVVYGPAAALYGADAMVGVINIVTAAPEKLGFRAEAAYGNLDDLHLNFYGGDSFAISDEPLKLTVYGLFGKRGDLNVVNNYADTYDPNKYWQVPGFTISEFKRKKLPAMAYGFGANAEYGDFTLSYNQMYRSEHSSIGQATNAYYYNDPKAQWGDTIYQATLKHRWGIGDSLVLNSMVSYLRYRLDAASYFDFVFVPNRRAYKYMASDDLMFQEVAVFMPWDALEIVAGATYQLSGALPKTNDLSQPFEPSRYESFAESIDYEDPLTGKFGLNPHIFHNVSVFAQGAYYHRLFTAVGGVRWDYNSIYGNSLTPRVGAQATPWDGGSIRASFNMAFKAPTDTRRYNSVASPSLSTTGDLLGVTYFNVPNLSLQPERAMAWELGARQVLADKYSIELVGFIMRVEDLIASNGVRIDGSQTATLPGVPTYANRTGDTSNAYINGNGSWSLLGGADLIFAAKNVIEAIRLNAELSLSVRKGEELLPKWDGQTATRGDFSIPDFRLEPVFMGKLRLSTQPTDKIYIGIDGVYCTDWVAFRVEDRKGYENKDNHIDGYVTFDAVFSYALINQMKVMVTVQNLFDSAYSGTDAYATGGDLLINPQKGITFNAGVVYEY